MTGESRGAGRVIEGKYELLTRIGSGGMSDVWLARDRRLDKLWAVKEIKPDVGGAQGEANRRALIDEANFMKRLDHPAIPRVVDIIEEGPVVFVVMDYVEGHSLGRLLRQRGTSFDQQDVIGWGVELCDVLGYLHTRDPPVVYRDMKPGNVMLREDGSVRLIDFGIAEELVFGRGDDGRIIGSAGYSAPEQVERQAHDAHPTDTRADVYALGTTLFSLVTGEVPRPLEGPDGTETMALALRPIRQVDPRLSDGLEQVILRATRRDPDERYQTVAEMRYDLTHCEELTEAWRERQRRKVRHFRGQLLAALCLACVGTCCLGLSVVVRNGSYETLVHEAGAAQVEEVDVVAGDPTHGVPRKGEASEAERLLTQAIEVDPSRMEAYEDLLSVYKADQAFTSTESQRWMQVWKRHGQALGGDPSYARLCFDVGVLYLCYYDYLDTRDTGVEGGVSSGGQAAIESATLSSEWFARARGSCDPIAGDYRGLVVGDALDEYAATGVYEQIGRFHTRFLQASQEGRDTSDAYRDLWEGLDEVVMGDGSGLPLVSRSEPIVQLRLYQVAFEAISSPTYLAGLMRAGVGRDSVEDMLGIVKARVDGLSDFAEANRTSAGPMYDEVENGFGEARDNVRRTFGNPVVAMSAQGEET